MSAEKFPRLVRVERVDRDERVFGPEYPLMPLYAAVDSATGTKVGGLFSSADACAKFALWAGYSVERTNV